MKALRLISNGVLERSKVEKSHCILKLSKRHMSFNVCDQEYCMYNVGLESMMKKLSSFRVIL